MHTGQIIFASRAPTYGKACGHCRQWTKLGSSVWKQKYFQTCESVSGKDSRMVDKDTDEVTLSNPTVPPLAGEAIRLPGDGALLAMIASLTYLYGYQLLYNLQNLCHVDPWSEGWMISDGCSTGKGWDHWLCMLIQGTICVQQESNLKLLTWFKPYHLNSPKYCVDVGVQHICLLHSCVILIHQFPHICNTSISRILSLMWNLFTPE